MNNDSKREELTSKAYIANGCCVAQDDENNCITVIYVPKRENGTWFTYGPDGVKPAPSFSYRMFF